MKGKKRGRRAVVAACLMGLAILIAGYTYLNTGYCARESALAALESSAEIRVIPTENTVIFMPDEPVAGLIFYPGGKVDHLAYAPLMRGLAEEGIACVLVEMPFDLAVLDMDAAGKVRGKIPEIDIWYLAGHSLGGAMAASYASDCSEDYAGLILLASYSTKELNHSGMKVLSLYATEDQVLDMEQYAACWSNLPPDAEEAVLEGGNHAQFGSYGPQEGDGEPAVTAQEQMDWAISNISDFILKK